MDLYLFLFLFLCLCLCLCLFADLSLFPGPVALPARGRAPRALRPPCQALRSGTPKRIASYSARASLISFGRYGPKMRRPS